jgi:hypothetical protein
LTSLLTFKANVSATTKGGLTPLNYAAIKMLMLSSSKIDAGDLEGVTQPHLAVQHGH